MRKIKERVEIALSYYFIVTVATALFVLLLKLLGVKI